MRYLMLVLAMVLCGVFAAPTESAAKGLREGPPSGVVPEGQGPLPKGKSDIIDDVLKYMGWTNCVYHGGTYYCSPEKKR